jgi:hypothetical protein
MHEVQFQRALFGRYLTRLYWFGINPHAGKFGSISIFGMQCAASDRPLTYAHLRGGKRAIAHNVKTFRLSYLFTPVVGVSAGVWVAPDFGMTVSFMVVGGIFG